MLGVRGRPAEGEVGDQHDYVAGLIEKLRRAHVVVFGRLGRAAARQKQVYDSHVKPVQYAPGDKVFMFHPIKKLGLSPKLQRLWTGPWEVVERISEVVYRIRMEKKGRVVHCDLLKKAC